MKPEDVALFDLDGTLCDYEFGMRLSMEKLRSPNEPPYAGVPHSDTPAYLKNRPI